MNGMGENQEGMGFKMPMLVNNQQNMFGAYNQDNSAVPSVLQGPVFQDESTMGGNEDHNDAKRRRIARVKTFLGVNFRRLNTRTDSDSI